MSTPPVPELEGAVTASGATSAPGNEKENSDVDINELKKIADSLMEAYNASQSTATLEEAIAIYEQVLDVTTARHENRAQSANDLGDALFWFCHRHNADKMRGDLCISLLREALHLRTLGHPLRDQSLHSLARALRVISFEQQSGGRSALNEAAAFDREALQLRPLGHVKRASSLNNLAVVLMTIFEYAGGVDVLCEAIVMQREVLQLLVPDHPGRITCLLNLGNMLRTSFELQGDPEILAEALRLRRECVQLCDVEHPGRPLVLEALASTLTESFVYQRQADLLSEAINLQREALQLLPESFPGRGTLLGNFGDMLLLSYHEQGGAHVLSEALTLFRAALSLQSTGDPKHPHRLGTLAKALQASFDLDGNMGTLAEAISLHREALKHQPLGYPARTKSLRYLADALCKLSPPAWTEAFSLYNEALETSPAGDITRAGLFSALAKCFLDPSSPFFNLSEGIVNLAEGHADSSSHVKLRLRYAVTNLRYVEDAFNAGNSFAGVNAESNTKLHKQVMALYSQVMTLLPRAANFGLNHDERLHAVAGSDELARNAAARAIILGNVTQAVEFLEEGRGVFWSQALHLKATGFDGVPDDLRDELKRMLSQLERSSRKLEILSQTTAEREQETEARRRLNEEAEDMISKIRGHPGLDRFLMPPAFSAIMASLPDGYVVIVNASRLGHHALILHRAADQVISLELKPRRGGFDFALARAHLPRDGSVSLDAADGGTDYDSRGMRLVASKPDVDSFDAMLTLLWTSIVQPVISAVGLEVTTGRSRPRLWWCLTGELGFLPIHAAGRHRDIHPISTSDYVVSSYVPTLTSLVNARQGWVPVSRSQLAGLVICETSDAASPTYLPQAANEVRMVRECFEAAEASVLNASSTRTSVSELRALLEDTHAHVLHLACHGIQDSNPLRSAIVLQDGKLTVEDIMRLSLPHAVLAFLSACQTAKGDKSAPDQAIHIAASMLFCGFKSVIGTMWLMHDADGPKLAQRFYEALFSKEDIDLDDVAYALDEGVQALRKAGVPAQRWALFMHMGG